MCSAAGFEGCHMIEKPVEKESSVQIRRMTKAVAGIVCCLGAYVGAVSFSAQHHSSAFRVQRSEAPAMAAVYPAPQKSTTLARGVAPVVHATIASAK